MRAWGGWRERSPRQRLDYGDVAVCARLSLRDPVDPVARMVAMNKAAKVSHRNLGKATQAAIDNEALTRDRVQTLEQWSDYISIEVVDRVVALEAIGKRTFWGRLRWLVTGQ